jgi:GntR family transcriptional regulator
MLVRVTKRRVRSFAQAFRRENRITPLYHQVEQVIRYRIATRQYASGLRLPSEHNLGRELKVSRVTIRQALRELSREHLLVKFRGRGTFVAPAAPQILQLIKYNAFLDEACERITRLEVVTVEIARAPVIDQVRALLRIPATATEIVQIKRCRHVDGQPFSFTVNYLPTEIGATLDRDALITSPLNAVLERDLTIPILRASETIEAVAANPEVARQLGIRVLCPVMHVTRVMFTKGDRPLEVVETFYRADKIHYSVRLSRVKRNGKWTWRHDSQAQ